MKKHIFKEGVTIKLPYETTIPANLIAVLRFLFVPTNGATIQKRSDVDAAEVVYGASGEGTSGSFIGSSIPRGQYLCECQALNAQGNVIDVVEIELEIKKRADPPP